MPNGISLFLGTTLSNMETKHCCQVSMGCEGKRNGQLGSGRGRGDLHMSNGGNWERERGRETRDSN